METDTGKQRWCHNFNFSEMGLGFALELTLCQDPLYFQQVWLSREKCQGGKLSSFSNDSDSQTLRAGTHLITIRFVEPLWLCCPSPVEPCTLKAGEEMFQRAHSTSPKSPSLRQTLRLPLGAVHYLAQAMLLQIAEKSRGYRHVWSMP